MQVLCNFGNFFKMQDDQGCRNVVESGDAIIYMIRSLHKVQSECNLNAI